MENIRVLLVEDSKVNQMVFKRFVESENLSYHYIIAGSVSEARKILDSEKFDIVITDYLLGDGTAFDILDLIKQVPIIVTTGINDQEVAVKAMKAGAYDYLIKDPQCNYLKVLPVTVENAIKRQKAEEQSRMLSHAMMNINDSVYITDLNDKITFVNRAFCKTYGYQEEDILDRPSNILWKEESASESLKNILSKTTGSGQESEFYHKRKDGSEFLVSLSRSVIRDESGNAVAVVGVARDITERKRAEEALQQANEKLRGWVNELEQRTREISLLSEMGELLQTCLTAEEAHAVIAQSTRQLFFAESGALYVLNASQNLVEAVASWGESTLSEQVFAPDECWALRRGRVHLVEDPRSGLHCRHLNPSLSMGYLCVPMMAQGEALGVLHLQSSPQSSKSEEMRERRVESKRRLAVTTAEQIALALANLKLRETLRLQSIRDPLTGLFNRRYMEESLEREVRRVTRSGAPLGIIMLDLDHFKRFNDTFGHAAGDTLLRELGVFLQKQIRLEDIACRYGGEEFTLILPEAPLEVTWERAEQLREGVKHLDVRHRGQSLGTVTLSLGVAVLPEHGSTAEAILRAADAALYRAKVEGRDRVVVEHIPT